MNEFQRRLLDTVEFNSWVASFADPARTLLGLETYAYVVDARGADLAADAASDFDLVMDSDSEFLCVYTAGAAVLSAPAIADPANGNQVTEFSPSVQVQITDQASGKTWFDQFAPLPLVAGAGGFPFILPSPRVVKPRSTLTVSAQMIDVGAPLPVAADFLFVLHGAKLYYSGPSA